MADDGTQTWGVSQPEGLLWRHWDGEFLVYHPASGNTHLLQPLAAAAVRGLEAGPADAAELARRVAGRLGSAPGPDLVPTLATLLAELDELGLIERVVS